MIEHFIIPDAQNAHAEPDERNVSLLIPCRDGLVIMNGPVNFDNEPRFRTIEVNNVPADSGLTPELASGQISIPKVFPE